ncbi:HAD family hydrolase [Bariatricus sp. SGI.154]|uniref:HAD family hydrolase n=1 Tax=Bariatricus sp. SGI.154 TaxID=3420549 RepID=UPI003D027839
MKIEGIIFDVDGTLWDSTEQVAISWNQAIREKSRLDRVLTADDLKKEFGKPLDEIMDDLFPELSAEEKDQLADHLYRYENDWVEKAPCILYDKMPETIRELSKEYRLFIVSNCQAGYIEAFLKNTGLEAYITDYTCPGDTGRLKGENIRIIMERNGIHKAVYVGDTQGDADACKEAGIPMIFAAYGFGQVAGEYPVIHSFDELIDLNYDAISGE